MPPRAATPRPRVLLIGDSILDQEGSAAAFLLQQSGVDAKAIGLFMDFQTAVYRSLQ